MNIASRSSLILVFLSAVFAANAQVSKVWVADNGDGTYTLSTDGSLLVDNSDGTYTLTIY